MARKVSRSGTTKYFTTPKVVTPKVSVNFVTRAIDNVTGVVERLWRVDAENESVLSLGMRGILNSQVLNASVTNITSNVVRFIGSQACIYATLNGPHNNRQYIGSRLELNALGENVTSEIAATVSKALVSRCMTVPVDQTPVLMDPRILQIGAAITLTSATCLCAMGIFLYRMKTQDDARDAANRSDDSLRDNLLEDSVGAVEMARP